MTNTKHISGWVSFVLIISTLFSLASFPAQTYAGMLTLVNDTITDSAPGATTTSHTIAFVTPTAIPIGGKILLRFEATGGYPFTIPGGLDYTDIDLAVATSSGLIDRPLDAAPSATMDGVSVVSGNSGSITITLGAMQWGVIPANSVISIEIGAVATRDSVGDMYIVNPTALTSYRVRVDTKDASNALLDNSTAMIAIVSPVLVDRIKTGDPLAPVRSNGLPSGFVLGSTVALQISLNTDRYAVCQYDPAPGGTFGAMFATMTPIMYGFTHFSNIYGIVSSTTYTYYIRCANESRITNTDDYVISFEVGGAIGTATNTYAGIPQPGKTGTLDTPQGASSFSGPGPVGGPYLFQGVVTVDGDTIPGGAVSVLRDGVEVKKDVADSAGHFTMVFDGLDRATYSWGIVGKDPRGKPTSLYTSVIYLIGGTNNIIAPIYLSPTISGTSTIELGDDVVVEGYGIPRKNVEIVMKKQGELSAATGVNATTTTNANGYYRTVLPAATLEKGTYEVKARTVFSDKDKSMYSPIFYVGLGETPTVDFSLRSDLNKDGKVNLIDFSILLYNWKTDDPIADINQDGTVNLTDFSIMLANWTG